MRTPARGNATRPARSRRRPRRRHSHGSGWHTGCGDHAASRPARMPGVRASFSTWQAELRTVLSLQSRLAGGFLLCRAANCRSMSPPVGRISPSTLSCRRCGSILRITFCCCDARRSSSDRSLNSREPTAPGCAVSSERATLPRAVSSRRLTAESCFIFAESSSSVARTFFPWSNRYANPSNVAFRAAAVGGWRCCCWSSSRARPPSIAGCPKLRGLARRGVAGRRPCRS